MLPDLLTWQVSSSPDWDTCALPAGTITGDLLVAGVLAGADDVTIDGWSREVIWHLPEGYDEESIPYGNRLSLTALIRRVDGSETDPVVVSGTTIKGVMIGRVVGVDDSVYDGGPALETNDGGFTVALWDWPTTVDDVLVLLISGFDGGDADSASFVYGSTKIAALNADDTTVLAMGTYPAPSAGMITVLSARNDGVGVTGSILAVLPFMPAPPPPPPPIIGGLLRTAYTTGTVLQRTGPDAPIVVIRTEGSLS